VNTASGRCRSWPGNSVHPNHPAAQCRERQRVKTAARADLLRLHTLAHLACAHMLGVIVGDIAVLPTHQGPGHGPHQPLALRNGIKPI
jgi:hypothetical protein